MPPVALSDATERFSALMLRGEDSVPLDEAALCIAAHGVVRLDVDAELRRLDELAEGCPPTVRGLVRFLWVEQGFAGDSATYYDPRNSYLDQVVRRRRGIPISLAVLAMEVGRRAGVALRGVGLPGHFVVRVEDEPDTYLDPFTGRLLDAEGCAELCRMATGQPVVDPAWLAPVGPYAICARILANLKAIAARHGERDALVWITRLRCLIPGVPDSERQELARLLAG